MMKGGFMIDNSEFTDVDAAVFQIYLIKTQMALENNFINYAIQKYNGKPVIILCDRGTMDGKAYCSERVW